MHEPSFYATGSVRFAIYTYGVHGEELTLLVNFESDLKKMHEPRFSATGCGRCATT